MRKVTLAVLGTTLLLGGCAQNIYNQPAPAKPAISHPTLPPISTIKPSVPVTPSQPSVPVVTTPTTPSVPVHTNPPVIHVPTVTPPHVVTPSTPVAPKPVVPQHDNSVSGVTAHVVNNLLASPAVRNLTDSQSPKVWVSNIQNRTADPINTNILMHQVNNGLMESGLFTPVSGTKIAQARQQLGLSANAQLVEQSSAISFGKMIGANYMVYGAVTPSNQSVSPYKVTLRLMDLKTGAIEWSGHATQGE